MINKENWEDTKKKYQEFWAKENHDRPLLFITAPRENYTKKEIKEPDNIEERWTDTEYVIKKARNDFNATYYGADAYPNLWPDLGPDILVAYLGSELIFGEQTSWSTPTLNDWGQVKNLRFDSENKWWQKTVEMTKAMMQDSNGDYMVGITDLHPGADAIASLRGLSRFCIDLYDNPAEVKEAIFKVLDVFKKTMDLSFEMTNVSENGTTNWMDIWHPGRYYVTSADILYMISEQMYDEFLSEELFEEVNWLEDTIFHLDGVGSLKHLDSLLKIEKLNGIQWMYGAGQPSAAHWIPELKKIQNAGKLIQVDVMPSDLDILLEELKPEGVMYMVRTHNLKNPIKSEQEAKDIVKKVEKSFKKTIF